jgi:hypothetical protein
MILTSQNTEMMLKIECTCGHVGLAASETLPRLLTCSACSTSRRVEVTDCARIRNNAALFEQLGLAGSAR